MTVECVENNHESRGFVAYQDGMLIAWTRFVGTDCYIDFEEDTTLDIDEMKKILEKMIELQLDLKEQPNAACHDKAQLYEKLCKMSPGEFKKLVDQKIWKGKDFDELVAAWPETI